MSEEIGTFVFADLAGFTALTEAHGDHEAMEITASFAARVGALLPEYHGEQIKTIGDEVMIRVREPAEAVRLGLRIVDELAAHGAPPVRVGMHAGPALQHEGDWYGSTVNLASRVAGAARAGEVLLTDETRRRLDGPSGIELEEHGSHYFKHIRDPIPLYRAIGPGGAGHELEIDPVCRMAVDRSRASSVKHRRGVTYYFCSPRCRRMFDAGPRRYIASSPAARAARKGFVINLSVFLIVGAIHLAIWAIGPQHRAGPPSMLLLYGAWAIALAFHYRAVRAVL